MLHEAFLDTFFPPEIFSESSWRAMGCADSASCRRAASIFFAIVIWDWGRNYFGLTGLSALEANVFVSWFRPLFEYLYNRQICSTWTGSGRPFDNWPLASRCFTLFNMEAMAMCVFSYWTWSTNDVLDVGVRRPAINLVRQYTCRSLQHNNAHHYSLPIV